MVSKFTRGMFDRNPIRNRGIKAGLRRRDAYQRRNCNTDLVENFKMMSVGETRPRYNNRTRKPRCYTCRRRGHTYRNCQSNQYTTDPREETVDIDQTRNREEHVQKYSDKVAVKGDYLVHGTEHGDWNNIWFVSDKYSKHMTPNRNIFVQFKRCFAAATKEHDSNFLFTHGIGEVEVDTNNRTYVVPSVSYVPEIGINLLSMKQLACQGFEIDIDGSNCTIRRMFNEKYDEMTGEEVLENQDNYLHHYFEELEKNTTQNDEGNTVGEELS